MADSPQGNAIHLRLWMELTGKLCGISRDEHFTHVRIEHWMLSFPNGSEEADLLRQKLAKAVGKKIGVLRTDLPDNPLLVRVID